MAQTYNEVYLEIRRCLRNAGVEDSAPEARLLLSAAAGKTQEQLLADMRLYPSCEVVQKAWDLVRRRLEGEPCAYIMGCWEFYGMPMLVNSSVLIPRVDTEVLVDTARKVMDSRGELRILDLCCGSGCIGCALAKHLPASRVVMGDISPQALAVCRRNIALNRLNMQAVCLEADALSPAPDNLGRFDLLVSNPPYIETGEIQELDPSVRDWEPHLALDGGADGLLFYRAILTGWKSVLKDNGTVIFELGEGQADPVKKLLREAGFQSIGGAFDTLGVERVVYGSL